MRVGGMIDFMSSSTQYIVYVHPEDVPPSETITPHAARFMNEHHGVSAQLDMIRDAIDKYFGVYKKLDIDVLVDPEEIDTEHLSITIVTALSAEDAYKRLKQFDYSWWLDQPFDLRQQVTISVESK
jgi:hypothetical protein